MVDASAQRYGVRLGPRVAAVGAAVTHDVDVLREVALVVFTFVGDSHYAAVFGGYHCRNAVVGRSVVARMIQFGAGEERVVLC